MQHRIGRAVPLALAALAAGCSQSPAAAAPSNPAFVGSIAEGNRAFGLALYQQLAARPGNVLISPISIARAFGPIIAGAEGETRTVIARALRFPADGSAALHPQLGGLLRGLERDQNGTTLSIANALWVQQGFTMKPAFARIAREDYGATSENLDFVRAPGAAAARINGWSMARRKGASQPCFRPMPSTTAHDW